MELTPKSVHLVHDDDSYEIVVSNGQVLEIWRYRNNTPSKPEFVQWEWLDEILQDRIHDRVVRLYGEPNED